MYTVPSAINKRQGENLFNKNKLRRTSDSTRGLNLVVLESTVFTAEGHDNDFPEEWYTSEQQSSSALQIR